MSLYEVGGADPLTQRPPFCVEVLSRWDKRKDINEKVEAYLAAGVEKVILIETDARLRYFISAGEQTSSKFGLQLTLPSDTYPL
jgi:Uma2 family endonuclease